jgi:hypothetical protein
MEYNTATAIYPPELLVEFWCATGDVQAAHFLTLCQQQAIQTIQSNNEKVILT